jgi:hypothetical protein
MFMDTVKSPSRGRIVLFAAGTIGIAIFLFSYYAFTWRNFAGVTDAIPPFKELFCDFVDYYYPMGEAIFRTEFPIQGFLYSPFIAILLAAFPPLGLNISLVLWGILQVFSVVIYLLLFRWLVPARLPIQLLFVTLALSSYPLVLNQLGGQVSVFMIVGILGLLVLYERGQHAAGAGLLAFAASFKFYPIFFLAPFASRRDSRFLLFSAAACGLFFFVVPGILLGIGDISRFYGALLDSFRDSAWIAVNPHSQFFPHLVLRLAGTTVHDARTYLPLLYGISYGIAAANMGLIYLVQRARIRYADLWSFQLVFLTIPFVLKTSWPHDFVFLSFTQALLVWRLLEGAKKNVTLFLVLPSIVLSNMVFFNLFGDFTNYGFCGFLFWANLLLLIALYIHFLPPSLRRNQ